MKKIKKILIVDDVKIIRLALAKELTARGYEVIETDKGLKAIEICNSENKPDLVFLDLKLPDISGIQALRQIRLDNPEIPVVVVSALDMQEVINEALASGATAYLTKPVNFDKLFGIISQIETGEVKQGTEELKKVAIISSIATIRLGVKRAIGDLKVTLTEIKNEDEFEEKFKYRRYDIIIYDQDFERTKGINYLQKLLEEKKVLPESIVMIITNSGEGDTIKETYQRRGINKFIVKPIDIEGLRYKFRKWFNME